MTASATAALAQPSLGDGHGHAAFAGGSPMAMLARYSSASAPGWPGWESSISAAPSAAYAMTCAVGEETRAPRLNRVNDSSRIPGVGPRAAAVPSAQREMPQPSSVRWLVVPPAVVPEVVTELSPECLRLREEVEIAAAEDDEFLRRRRLPAYHQQAARDVVDAVAVPVQRHDTVRVLEQADIVGQPLQVPEWRNGVAHGAPEAD